MNLLVSEGKNALSPSFSKISAKLFAIWILVAILKLFGGKTN